MLGIRHIKIGEEYDLDPVFYIRVIVHNFAYRINQLDNQLCLMISGRCRAPEDKGAGNHVNARILLYPKVKCYNVQYIKFL